jgi:Flp pilus assembly protein TadG
MCAPAHRSPVGIDLGEDAMDGCTEETSGRVTTRRDERGERGAVALEFALIMPLLIMLMMGITTAGLSYSQSIGLTNAVREGARFGATTVTSPSTLATWSGDVVAQVRGTQFDDTTAETGVCVQLWKKGTGEVAGACSVGQVPTLSRPASETNDPAVPSSVPTGACVVRVVAARNFTINIGLVSWDRVTSSSSVARYERSEDFPTCA